MNKKLVDSGLFADRMVPITGPLVILYNRCLTTLGFEPTSLPSFRIDAYGWSPEIAKEKGNPAYLSHGDANPFAIILSPSQQGLPVFYPFHNFDRRMMNYIYTDYAEQIAEITKTTAIIVDIDSYVDFIDSPVDLLKYDKITIKADVLDGLIEGKEQQDHLIEEFMEGDNFLTIRAHQKLLGNVKRYGDLRNKNIKMEPESFNIGSFFTRMFGGVFVLRDTAVQKPLLIMLDKTWADKVESTKEYMALHISDEKVITTLTRRGFIQDLTDEGIITRMKDWALASVLDTKPERKHPVGEIMSNNGLYTKYLQDYKSDLQFYKAIETNKIPGALAAAYEPRRTLEVPEQHLIWKLLTYIQYYEIFLLYKWNKEKFYEEFESFSEDLQDWVVTYVVKQNNLYNKNAYTHVK